MSQPNMTEDLNIIANSAIEITYMDGDLNIIQKLDDEPNDVGGLTSAELKAKFDEAGNTIKTYINETLIPEILAADATEAARAAAEVTREANEAQRIENENARIAAEQARANAESARSDAETQRADAESARNTAEQARESAEQARADETAGIVAQATEQAVIASNAASEASSSASGASTSASSAAASAASASDSASASASSATAAKASADEALSSKNSAKSEADRAKSEADRAEAIVGSDFVKSSEKGAANGVATLGADGKVPTGQLPAMDYAPSTHASQHGSGGSDPITPAAIGAAVSSHTHDDRYYTETEVNDLLNAKAPAYTYGTEDMTAGTSALETGKLYFVYE